MTASRQIISSQTDVHERLSELVGRYRESVFQKPVSSHSVAAFEALAAWLEGADGPVIYDMGCGTGDSSRKLVQQFPGARVVGVDRSESRLSRDRTQAPAPLESMAGLEGSEGAHSERLLLLRADIVDLVVCMRRAGLVADRQYYFYPNPYPKAVHVQRRWHASPIFPHIVALGGLLEVRTNWQVYALEMVAALKHYGVSAQMDEVPHKEAFRRPVSLFEAKYARSQQTLYRVRADLRCLR